MNLYIQGERKPGHIERPSHLDGYYLIGHSFNFYIDLTTFFQVIILFTSQNDTSSRWRRGHYFNAVIAINVSLQI